MDRASCPSSVLASIREGWLDGALPEVIGDDRVVGLALVGSLGRGEGDDWSDVDLLVVVRDAALGEFAGWPQNRLWASADLLIDSRQNAAAGATSVGTLYVLTGLPLGVDWYVYPASMAGWPSDCSVIHDPVGMPWVEEQFAAFNARGPRQAATVKTADEVRLARLAMVPIAGKYVARRSAAAVSMIKFIGGTAAPVGAGPAEQLQALRVIAGRLSTGSSRQIEDAVDAYLGLVESTIV